MCGHMFWPHGETAEETADQIKPQPDPMMTQVALARTGAADRPAAWTSLLSEVCRSS